MGEVYKARDTRLDRSVAIKVVSELLTASPDLRVRLEREARAISQLNHPHICTLYDIGREGSTDYLVLEYLEGETLEERIARGPLSLEEVARIGIQVCDALDRAHRAGLVHRDLKPANVMLTRGGAKLLDFGLAKAVTPLTGATITARPLTGQGTILGTLHYMSPEQVEGRDADARSDIFSLGAVLYEMVTGKHAFTGTSAASVMSAILRDTPPRLASVVPIVPASLDRIVRGCLEKTPDDRWQSTHDILLLLRDLGNGEAPGAAAAAPRRRWTAPAAVALALAAVGYAAWQGTRRPPVPEAFPFHLEVTLPEGHQLYRDTPELAVTRDGRRLAVTLVDPDGNQRVYVRDVDEVVWRPVVGAEGGMQPFWSPDGRRIAFFAAGRLRHVSVGGGPVQDIAPVSEPRGGAWLEDDTILLSPHPGSGILRVSAKGGNAQTVTTPAAGETHRFPFPLPGGGRLLYWIGRGAGRNSVHVVSVDGGNDRPVIDSDTLAGYGGGKIFFVRDGAILAQSFDLETERVVGEPSLVTDAVDFGGPPGSAALAVASTGTILYCSGGQVAPREIVWRDRGGTELSRIGEHRRYGGITMSPDGRRLAVTIRERAPSSAIWTIDVARGVPTRLTGSGFMWFPVWRPDSQGLILRHGAASSDAGLVEHSLMGASTPIKGTMFPVSVAEGGKVIVGHETGDSSSWDIYEFRDGTRRSLISTSFADVFPSVSPDGRWIAWMSDESGHFEVYVARYPGLQGKERISVNGGGQPLWRADSKELFFIGPGQLMAVKIDAAGELHVGSPSPLFAVSTPAASVPYPAMYAVSRDGAKFAVLELARGGPRPTLRLVSAPRPK